MRGYRLAAGAVACLLLSIGAAPPGAAASPPLAPSTSPSRASAPAAAPSSPITTNGAWTVYHHDDGHAGFDSTLPGAFSAAAGWSSATLDEAIYGEPLVFQGIVYVATLNNSVYALNQADGTVVWSRHLSAPETDPNAWACGNVSPQGILGTPVIDASTNRIYVATFGHDHVYRLIGLNLATGAPTLSTVITTPAGASFDWTIEQQRGALAVRNGYVYVPFGGRAGDCGNYHGYIFAVPTNGAAVTHWYVTPGAGAGFWTAGGVVVDDSTGKVFDTSGNGVASGCDNNPDGSPVYLNDAVTGLSPTLALQSYFVPVDWQASWCQNDQDLGSASMVLITPTLAFQAGKWGQGFLVNPQALGGMNGQLFPAASPYTGADVCYGNHADANFGSYAYAAPYVYLSCDGNGLVGLQVNTGTPSFSLCDATCASPTWKAGAGISFGPPIVAAGAVWAVDTGGGGLYGFDATTGAQIFNSGGFGATHFTTPSEAGAQIFVGSGNQVLEFNMTFCQSAGLLPTSPTQQAGSIVAFTASSTGCTAPRYEFWVQYPNGSWNLIQPWGGATFNWDTSNLAPGTYTVHAWVNARGTGHDAIAGATVTLTGCTSASLAPPSTTQPAGSLVNLTASSGGCTTPNYEFWVHYPNGTWNLKQMFSSTATFGWDTTGLAPGLYTVHAWAIPQGASQTLEVYGNSTVTLTGCSAGSLTPSNPSQAAGTTFNFTATSSGCLNPLYEFWVQYPDMSWNLKQAWNSSNAFSWSTLGLAPGLYTVHAWVSNTATTYEAIDSTTATLTGCMSASVTPSPVSQPAGSTIAFTASSGNCPGPQYEYWAQYPGGVWHLLRGFGAAAFNWSTAGLGPGLYTVHVWVNNQGTGHDDIGTSNVTLTGCTSASVAPMSGTTAVGTSVLFTASSTCSGVAIYEFWLQYPDASWHLQQAFSTTNTWTWMTTGRVKGNYVIHVWVNNQGSDTTTYEIIGSATRTLN